jgi:hypothetical protein
VPKSSSLAIVSAFVIAGVLAAPQGAAAQRAVVRPVGRRPVVVGRPGFRSPVFIGGFGFGYPYLYNPWWGDYGYGYPYPVYGGYVGYSSWDSASLRLQVTPREAEVFVDGYRAGIVDNFDGIFQRLHVRPGGHDLAIYMPGFRTFSEHVYASPSSSQSIKMTLLPLAPGESMSPPPMPSQAPPPPAPGYGRGGMRTMPPVQVGPGGNYAQPQGPPPAGEPPLPPIPPGATPIDPSGSMPPPVNPQTPADPSSYGTLALRVQPSGGAGTVIMIDGERWAAPGTNDQLLVRLAEGRHHVEVRRPGFATFAADVTVQRGASTPLNVGLIRR